MSAAITANGKRLLLNGTPHNFFGMNCYFLGQGVAEDAITDFFSSLPPYTLIRFWCSQNSATDKSATWGATGTIDWTNLDYLFEEAANYKQLLLCSLSQFDQPGEDTATFDYPGAAVWEAGTNYLQGTWVIDTNNDHYYWSKNDINSSTSPHSDSTNWTDSGVTVSGNGPTWISGANYAAGTWVNYTGNYGFGGAFYSLNALTNNTLDPPSDPTNWSAYRQGQSWFNPAGGLSGTTGYNAIIPGQVAPLSYVEYVTQVVNRYKNSPALGMWELMSEAECDCNAFITPGSASIGANVNSWTGGSPGTLYVGSTQFIGPGAGTGTIYYGTGDYANINYTGITSNSIEGCVVTSGNIGSGTLTLGGNFVSESSAAACLRAYFDNIGGLIHSLNPNHLTHSGLLGGGQEGMQGSDYSYIQQSAGIDVGSVHDYSGTTPLTANVASDIAAMVAINKPILVGECGIEVTADTPTAASRALGFQAKFAAQTAAGSSGLLIWNASLGAADTGLDVGLGDPALPGNRYPTVFDGASTHYRY